MNKITIFKLFAILFLFNNILFAQTSFYDHYEINNLSINDITLVSDMQFININTGFVAAIKKIPNGACIGFLYKTTNSGTNWVRTWATTFPYSYSGKFAVSFSNANTGYLIKTPEYTYMWGTTDGGYSFTTYNLSQNFPDYQYEPITACGSNNELYLIRKSKNSFLRFVYPLTGFYNYSLNPNLQLSHIEVLKSNNHIYVCGQKYYNNSYYPYLAKSTNYGQNFIHIMDFDGEHDTYNTGGFYHMCFVKNGNDDIIKISSKNKLIGYNVNSNALNELTVGSNWSDGRKISFSDNNNGFYLNHDFLSEFPEEPPIEVILPGIYKTYNNGQNWISDYSQTYYGNVMSWTNRFYSFGNIVLVTQSGNSNGQVYFNKRRVNDSVCTYYDDFKTTGTITINNQNYPTPNYHNFIGGVYPLNSTPIINENQPDEKIFYKWINGEFKNSITEYNLFYDGKLSAYYKTKCISATKDAISNSPQTKAIKDTTSVLNGIVHTIHESMGGVFYSRSTDGGNTFSKEEVVNYDDYTYDANENKNAYLNVLRIYSNHNPLTQTNQNNNVTATWERYNSSTQKTEIYVSRRYVDLTNKALWSRYYYQNNPMFTSFSAPSGFNSYPKVFAIIKSQPDEVANGSIYYVPHLEPYNTNQKKLVVSTSAYSGSFIRQDFELDNGNISDVSVTGIKASSTSGYSFYFTYIKDNNVIYRQETFYYDNGMSFYRNPNYIAEPISANDGQLTRISPDISLRNGLPVIAYRGTKTRYSIVKYEGGGEDSYVTFYYYPIVVRYKTGATTWSGFTEFSSDGQHTQEQPNVEGSKDANAYLINYKVGSSQYKQFTKVEGNNNYHCEPNTFNGTDAKLIRGCYTGLNGSSSSPMLLTLSPSSLLYSIGKQSFVITDQGSVFDYGFDNMNGVIDKNDAEYKFTLVPIIASNTTYGIGDGEPPTTVQNAVDFNSNMISNNFYLSDNDTLIIGAFGSYKTSNPEYFLPMKYQVDLISSTTGEHLRELFRDTVRFEDSVETEYLRGFIIIGIPNGADSFYVQLSVDTLDGGDGEGYGMGGEYIPEDNGDKPVNYKKKIHFEKDNHIKPVNNIPKEYSLSQNYPNPFNPVTNIKYQIPVNGFVSLKIYDITGREIANLVKEY